jgi:hypothetical protein
MSNLQPTNLQAFRFDHYLDLPFRDSIPGSSVQFTAFPAAYLGKIPISAGLQAFTALH